MEQMHCGICELDPLNGKFDGIRLNERFQVQGCCRPLANWNRLPGSLNYTGGRKGPENNDDGGPQWPILQRKLNKV